ncbi:MAG: SWIM zinc finger family protein [Lachnospiraceae bacterium]|nr:SWIM zinc finger family protein [Lachnospiraceae bacterium]
MNWKKLFATHILERGYDYYLENAIENIDIAEDIIRADVIGSEDYEVEISLNNGEVTDMYCSCPYALDGKNCKHMAAVLYEWSEHEVEEEKEGGNVINKALFQPADTINSYKKKVSTIEELVSGATEEIVRSFLVDVIAEDEKLLLRFHNTLNKQVTNEDVNNYIRQVDIIADRYLGRNRFINYYEAGDFISELEDIIDKDVRQMIDNGSYLSAFQVMNYIFVLIGDVDMDDSDGGTGMLADRIYQLWLELLVKVNVKEKKKMFDWFTSHLDGSVIDYLEEYIEQILMGEFDEEEYAQAKLDFIEDMIARSERKDSEWSRDYAVGKWAVRYLELLKEKSTSDEQIKEICKKYWNNSTVRRYYIDICMKNKEYDHVLQVLDECIMLDKQYRGLISEYSEKKKKIYFLQGNKNAYIEQLWQLVLDHKAGNLDLYRELKKQYTVDEWLVKREEIFKKLPAYAHVERLYEEEKLYDRLLAYVLNSSGIYALQEYERVLKKEYPKQILDKYKNEVNKMAMYTSDRKHYAYLVSLLQKMQRMEGGVNLVEQIVVEWKVKYKNRPAMMDELRKL